jgi:Transposase DDE domain
MLARGELYPEVVSQIEAATAAERVRITTVRRVALLVVGLLSGKSSVLGQMATGLWEAGVSAAQRASIERRLRRSVHDGKVDAATCYAPAVRTMVDWAGLVKRRKPAVLALDESSQDERVHLLRVSLMYWGTAVPLAWSLWPQNAPLEEGAYWQAIEAVLDQAAALVPPGLAVILTADRAFDVPPFVDRVAARGWHWVVRLKANAATRFRDHQGREHAVKALIGRYVAAPGQRWKARGHLFKQAGWRPASIVADWAPGAKEPVVVVTDLPPRWEVLRHYDRRFWIESGFRTDKGKGWQWEACQVTHLAHLERLLVAMAWATLLVLCLGLHDARATLHAIATATATGPTTRRPPTPQPARDSLFSLGLRLARRWLTRTSAPLCRWRLTHLDSVSWSSRFRQAQAHRFLFSQTVRS